MTAKIFQRGMNMFGLNKHAVILGLLAGAVFSVASEAGGESAVIERLPTYKPDLTCCAYVGQRSSDKQVTRHIGLPKGYLYQRRANRNVFHPRSRKPYDQERKERYARPAR